MSFFKKSLIKNKIYKKSRELLDFVLAGSKDLFIGANKKDPAKRVENPADSAKHI
jgi:hypothetical protein